jgi:hypothetical protein
VPNKLHGNTATQAGSSSLVPVLIVVALRGSLCLLKTAVMANRAALNDGLRRHIANPITNKGPEADAGRNGVVAHPRLGMVSAIAAFAGRAIPFDLAGFVGLFQDVL